MYMVRWWVDAYYNTYKDCKGRNGSMMYLGKVAVVSYSKKQETKNKFVKLNRKWISGGR